MQIADRLTATAAIRPTFGVYAERLEPAMKLDGSGSGTIKLRYCG